MKGPHNMELHILTGPETSRDYYESLPPDDKHPLVLNLTSKRAIYIGGHIQD